MAAKYRFVRPAAAKQDPVAYRRALLDKTPRAKAILELAVEKAGWGEPLSKGGRPRCLRPVRLRDLYGADCRTRCFDGLPYHCGFPQVRIVCQQIRGARSTLKTVTGDPGGRRLSSAQRNAPAARPRHHCRIGPAAQKGRVLRLKLRTAH